MIRFVIFFFCTSVLACDYPDEGNLPLRRAVTKVRTLPDVEAWAKEMHDKGAVVQYAVSLDRPHRQERRCFWTVDVNAEGRTWKRYYVTPDGRGLRPGTADPRPRAGR